MAYVAASKLLTGLRFESLPEGWTPVGAVLGALTIRTEMQRVALLAQYLHAPHDDDEDDE